MTPELEGRTAVVTGAAHGIGRAIAHRLASEGACVVLMDRDAKGLKVALAEIGRERATIVAVDLLDGDAVAAAFVTARDLLGVPEILVNNVGQGARERAVPFRDSTPDLWDFLIDICLKTTIACTRQVIGGMQDRGSGKIVNIASDSAYLGAKAAAAYAAAKNGVIGFTRSLAREVAADGISVNAVAPGYIRTRAQDNLPSEFVEKAIAETPMGRMGEPEDIARAVAFFAGPGSRYITGQSLIVNGGRWMN